MKKKRFIQIKDSRLRRVRLSLRQILLKESKKRLSETLDEERKILESINEKNRNIVSLDERLINNQINRLRNELSASIVVCALCRDIEGDRVINPKDRIWYCPECYEFLEESHRKELKYLGRIN